MGWVDLIGAVCLGYENGRGFWSSAMKFPANRGRMKDKKLDNFTWI